MLGWFDLALVQEHLILHRCQRFQLASGASRPGPLSLWAAGKSWCRLDQAAVQISVSFLYTGEEQERWYPASDSKNIEAWGFNTAYKGMGVLTENSAFMLASESSLSESLMSVSEEATTIQSRTAPEAMPLDVVTVL